MDESGCGDEVRPRQATGAPSNRMAIRKQPSPNPSQRSTNPHAGRPSGSLKPTLTRVPAGIDSLASPASHHGEPSSRASSMRFPSSVPSARIVAWPGTTQRGDCRRLQRKRGCNASRPGHDVFEKMASILDESRHVDPNSHASTAFEAASSVKHDEKEGSTYMGHRGFGAPRIAA